MVRHMPIPAKHVTVTYKLSDIFISALIISVESRGIFPSVEKKQEHVSCSVLQHIDCMLFSPRTVLCINATFNINHGCSYIYYSI